MAISKGYKKQIILKNFYTMRLLFVETYVRQLTYIHFKLCTVIEKLFQTYL